MCHKNSKLISKPKKVSKSFKNLTVFWLPNISNKLPAQRSPVYREAWFPGVGDIQQTDMATYRLNWPRGRLSENVGLKHLFWMMQ